MNDYFTLSNITKGSKVFLPIDCVLKLATDTSDHPYNSDDNDVKQLVPNDIEFDCPICSVSIEIGEGIRLRCHHYCCKYVYMLKIIINHMCTGFCVLGHVYMIISCHQWMIQMCYVHSTKSLFAKE